MMKIKTLWVLFLCLGFGLTLKAQTVLNLPDFKIIDPQTFEINQIEAAATLSTRLYVSLTKNNYKPVGLRVQAGTILKLNVNRLVGTVLPKLVTFTREYGDVTTYNLNNGDNTINISKTGNVYLQFSSATPLLTKVRVTFQSGYSQVPFYQMGITTNAEWQTMLADDTTSPDAILLSNRAYIVIKKSNADAGMTKNQDLLLSSIDKIIQLEGDISGLDGSQPEHGPFIYSQLMIHDKDSGNPDATANGRVRIPQGSIKWIIDPDYILVDGGWGMMHELGHQHQQWPYNWTANTEVQVNIHSLAAKRYFYPTQNGISDSDWAKTLNYLEKSSSAKNYDASSMDNYVKLAMYHQLWLAFGGDSFYQNLYKKVRADKPNPTTDEGERKVLLTFASQIAGKDLSGFFKQWGINATEATYNSVANLRLPAPAIEPSSFSESWVIKKKSLLQDTTVVGGNNIKIEVTALAPKGIKKVQFYNGTTLLAEVTSVPYIYNWTTANRGNYNVYAKIINGDDDFQTTQPVNVTVTGIELKAPVNSSSYLPGETVHFVNNAPDAAQITKVEYYDGNMKIAESTIAPFNFDWNNASNGLHSVSAKAYYTNNDTEIFAEVSIMVGGLLPTDDAYVKDGSSANTKYGKETTLVVKNDGASGFTRHSYIKFDLSQYKQQDISNAVLTLSVTSGNTDADKTDYQVYMVEDDSWTEDSITWNNKPSAGIFLVQTKGSRTSGAKLTWDITNQVKTENVGDKKISLVVIGANPGTYRDIVFGSKENAAPVNWPMLSIISTPSSVMPVNCNVFTAGTTNKGIVLKWSTATESNSKQYEILRSIDGKSFLPIKTIASHNKENGSTYEILDEVTAGVNYYYRLKQIDFDGTATMVCKEVTAKWAGLTKKEAIIYPNPAKDYCKITADELIKNVKLTNMSGQVLVQLNNNSPSLELKLNHISPGVYLLSLQGDTSITKHKLIVK